MLDIPSLRTALESRSGEPARAFQPAEVPGPLRSFLEYPVQHAYLLNLTPAAPHQEGDVILGPMDWIEEYMEALDPGSLIGQFGYLQIANTGSGNAICIDRDARVCLVRPETIRPDGVEFPVEPDDPDWVELDGLTAENVARAVEPLDDDLGRFLDRFLRGELDDFLDAIDRDIVVPKPRDEGEG